MNEIHEAFRKIQEAAGGATLQWRDEYGASISVRLDEVRLVVDETTHPTLFDMNPTTFHKEACRESI